MSPYYARLRRAVGDEVLLIPSAAAVVRNAEGELLLQEKRDGMWSLPAGAIEPGESPEEAMRRELVEEAGLTARRLSLVGNFGGTEFRHTYSNGDKVEYVVLLFGCEGVEQGGPPTDPETVSLRYFSREEFPGLALPYPVSVLYGS